MDVATMSLEDKLGEAVRRSAKYMPEALAAEVAAIFTPMNLAIMAGTLVVWAGSHFAGVGFIADIIVLCLGVVFLGWTAFELAGVLYDFATVLIDAKSEADLEKAAELFAKAILLAGVGAVSAVLLRGGVKAARASRTPAAPPPPATPPAPRRNWGENFEITPARPDRAAAAPTSALTTSAQQALARP